MWASKYWATQAVIKQCCSFRPRTFQLHISAFFFPSQEKANKQANGQTAFNLTENYSSVVTQGYHARSLNVWVCESSPYTYSDIWTHCVPLHAFPCTVCPSVCTHLSVRLFGNSLVDLPIVSHNLMLCRWDVQIPPMPLCLFFTSLPVLVDWETDDHPLNPTLSLILLS